MMVSVPGAAASMVLLRALKYTVLTPTPSSSVHVLVFEKSSHKDHDVPSFEKHICVAPVADRINDTLVLLVSTAPPLIIINNPLGGRV